MKGKEHDIGNLTGLLEKLLTNFGHNEFHARLLAGAIINILKEEGLISHPPDEETE